MPNIELNGKTYELRFTRYSIYKLTEQTGLSFAELMGETRQKRGATWFEPLLIWSCLVWKYDLTFEEFVRALPFDIAVMAEAAAKVFSEAMESVKPPQEK